jgi:hypothetical protein
MSLEALRRCQRYERSRQGCNLRLSGIAPVPLAHLRGHDLTIWQGTLAGNLVNPG